MLIPRKRSRVVHDEHTATIVRCLGILVGVIAFGTLGFMLVEREWGLWRSLFFTLITITTVGYGDQGLSDHGEAFAAILLLVGIGMATYSMSMLVQAMLSYHAEGKRKMQQRIDRLTDHFVVCGFGRIGQTVCEQLSEAGHPLVVIDCEPASCAEAGSRGYLVVTGNSTEDDTLERAGVQRARGIICATPSDAENVFITLSVRELSPDVFIASRASTESAARRMKRAGATFVVSPYTTAGLRIATALLQEEPTTTIGSSLLAVAGE